jgi:hypothetical protein
MIAGMVALVVLAGVWVGARTDHARLGAANAGIPLEQHVRASAREQFWFNAMFISVNMLWFSWRILARYGDGERVIELKRTSPYLPNHHVRENT